MLTNRQYETVGLRFVIDRLECHSYYGKEEIRVLNAKILDGVPLAELRGDIFDDLVCINELVKLPDGQIALIQEHLHGFKNIRGCVKKFPSTFISEVDLFELKGFMLALEQFLLIWNGSQIHLRGVTFSHMADALNILDKNKQRTAPFHIPHEDFPTLRKARQEKEKIENMIHKHGLNETLINERLVWVQKEDELEQQVLKELTDKLRPYAAEFLSNAHNIGRLDFLLAKAVLAKQTEAVCPTLDMETIYQRNSYGKHFTKTGHEAKKNTESKPNSEKQSNTVCAKETISLSNMWNPGTKEELQKNGTSFTKISIELPTGCAVITGANMGGKSIAIKTVLLNVILANIGFFVFADEAVVPLFDDLYFVEEETGDNFLSSFGTEVMQVNHIVKKIAYEKLFIAIDEPARATNPYEGAKIARGLVSFLEKQKTTALISTHYDDVHREAGTHYQMAGFVARDGATIEEIKNSVKYELRKVGKSAKVPAEALRLCEILGLYEPLLAEIQKIGV